MSLFINSVRSYGEAVGRSHEKDYGRGSCAGMCVACRPMKQQPLWQPWLKRNRGRQSFVLLQYNHLKMAPGETLQLGRKIRPFGRTTGETKGEACPVGVVMKQLVPPMCFREDDGSHLCAF